MNIGEVCTREVYMVNPGEPLLQAALEMRKRNVGCVIVVEQRGKPLVPIGIVTDRDIARALPEHPSNLGTLPVADIMTRDPLALCENESIVDAMVRLRQRGVRRAPVVAASGDLVGIVSTDDLLGIIAEQLGSLAHLVDRQTRSSAR
ncbi:MAG: CBS domain-containing protein [Steroidobacteraceae bacterium]